MSEPDPGSTPGSDAGSGAESSSGSKSDTGSGSGTSSGCSSGSNSRSNTGSGSRSNSRSDSGASAGSPNADAVGADVRVVEGIARIDGLDAFLAAVQDVRDATGTVVQAFDARYVVSRRHLVRAVELAERAADRDDAVARDRAVEVLLYAAGRRQIDRALEMGVGEGETSAVIVIYAPDGAEGPAGGSDLDAAVAQVRHLLTESEVVDEGGTIDSTDPSAVREFFDVTEIELDTVSGDLAALVLERVALLDVEK